MITADNRFIRQAELVDPAIFSTPVTVIGAGAIGSFTVLSLAKMGFMDITCFDEDRIEDHNLPNQYYPVSSVGEEKVIALKKYVQDMTGVEIKAVNGNWNRDIPLKGLVISAVDSMKVRAEVFKAILENKECVGFIDGRMGGQQGEVYAIRRGDRRGNKLYKSRLWTDNEASPLRCTQKAVLYNVLWIASTIANVSRLMLENKQFPWATLYDFENCVQINPVE